MAHSVAKKLSRFKSGTLFMGVDLGLDISVAKIMDDRAQVLTTMRFAHTRDDYNRLVERMGYYVQRSQATGIAVAMEPTNYFWKLLAAEFDRQHISWYLVNAYTVHKHREGDQIDRSKDDARDGFVIGDLLRTGKYTETRLLHVSHAELRQCVVFYDRLQQDIGRQKTLLRNTVGQLFPEMTSVFADLTGEAAIAMLRNHAAAVKVKAMSEAEFIKAVRADFKGQRLMVSKLCRVHKLAANSVRLVDGIQAAQLAVRYHLETLAMLEAQAASVRQTLTTTFHALPEVRYWLSIPSLGLVTAATILAEIGDPSNFGNSQQLIKLAGIQPTSNTSGRKTRSATPMSHQGRSRLRKCLYFACLRLIQDSDDFAQDYQRLQKRDKNPLTKMQALGVLMNKLLRILWALKRQVAYDPRIAQAA